MFPNDPKQVKQQENGFRWLQSLSKPREKRYQGSQAAGFLLLVFLMIAQPVAELLGYSILHWPGVAFYFGIFAVGCLFWVWLMFIQEAWPPRVRAAIFYGLGLGIWSLVLWVTQSIELVWEMAIVLVVFLSFELWSWMRKTKTP
jgi:hypothetical protein